MNFLFKKVDNSSLVIFRVLFGVLLFAEVCIWMVGPGCKELYVEAPFSFTFFGFEWLGELIHGPYMYLHFSLLGVAAICIALGYKYRLFCSVYAIGWLMVYLTQKTHYNNHYYLMVLLLFFMVLAPANRRFALDAKEKSVNWMPNWVRLFFILQLLIVYTYASINKMYPHWVDGTTMSVFMYAKRDYWLIGPYLQGKPFQLTVSYMAIAYDGLIIPAMLWRRTRTLAFIASVGFHVFNAIVFGVGIFPFMSLALFIFFFDPKAVNGAFFRGRAYFSNENSFTNQSQLIGVIFSLYFLIQIGLPLRHRFIDGNVFWTEEGHRMSWRMMLRSKGGHCHFLVYDENGRFRKRVKVGDIVHKSQSGKIKGRPDMILSFVRYVEQKIKDEEGFEPQIYCVSRVNLNGGPSLPLIDRDVDLTKVKWNPYGHNEWILSYPFTLNGK